MAILWSLAPNHGLTVAGLTAIAAVLVARALGMRSLRRPTRTMITSLWATRSG